MEIVPWVIAALVAGGSFAFFICFMQQQVSELKQTVSKQAEHIEMLQGEILTLEGKLKFEVGASQRPYLDAKQRLEIEELERAANNVEHERNDEPPQADWVGDDE
jgi:hypothetical protein